MANIDQFEVNGVYSFQVVSPVLGTFSGVTIEGFGNARKAQNFDIDPYAMHTNLFSQLPEGTPNNAASYLYIFVTLPNGKETALGLPWIIENSVEQILKTDAYIKLIDTSPQKEQLIREMCAGNGMKIGSLEFK